MTHAFGSLDELGDGYGFRKVRAPLGVTAFGVNALVMPPGVEGIHHYHDTQDEPTRPSGAARFEVDGEVRELGPGGLCHVESTAPRSSRTSAKTISSSWSSAEGRLRRARRQLWTLPTSRSGSGSRHRRRVATSTAARSWSRAAARGSGPRPHAPWPTPARTCSSPISAVVRRSARSSRPTSATKRASRTPSTPPSASSAA